MYCSVLLLVKADNIYQSLNIEKQKQCKQDSVNEHFSETVFLTFNLHRLRNTIAAVKLVNRKARKTSATALIWPISNTAHVGFFSITFSVVDHSICLRVVQSFLNLFIGSYLFSLFCE